MLSDDNFVLDIYHEITAGCSGHCRQGVWNRQSHHEARLSLSTVYIIFICQITALHRSQPWQRLWMVSSIIRSTLWAAEALYCCNGWRNYFHGSEKTAVIALKLTIVHVGDFQVLVVVCQMKDNMQMGCKNYCGIASKSKTHTSLFLRSVKAQKITPRVLQK